MRLTIEKPREPKEIEANQLAADLLMPEEFFPEVWVSRAGNAARVGAYFGITEQDVQERASNLGLPRSF